MKKLLTILFIIMLLITFAQIIDVYALYKNKLEGSYSNLLGVWSVKVNEVDISSGEADMVFPITGDYVQYETSNLVAEGHIAPSTGAYFDILIDPTDTDVAIKYVIEIADLTQIKVGEEVVEIPYDLEFELTSVEDTFLKDEEIDETTEHNNKVSEDFKSLSGVIPLSVINAGYQDRVRIHFKWKNNETYNEQDTELGTNEDGVNLIIPVKLTLMQYMGEAL